MRSSDAVLTTVLPEPGLDHVPTPAGPVERLVDGGDLDCGSGLLLLITRSMRRLGEGGHLGIRSAEPSVTVDLPEWADLVGHDIVARHAQSESGPWWFVVEKAGAQTSTVFSTGSRTPVGQRLWVYSNFDCNLACDYCCSQSSPKAQARRFPVETARQAFGEFGAIGGREVFITGGEPFMHPDLGALVEAAEGLERTVLTNAMILQRGRRREVLEALDRSVTLQVSLDSATADLHDRQRGAGSWSKALSGIELAASLGFRVRIAATLYDEDPAGVRDLHRRLDSLHIAAEDRVIRPVAQEGFADQGIHVSLGNLEPEPTLTVDGAWWHPVAVTNPNMRIADAPLPVSEVIGVVRDAVAVQDAATAAGREVFRCA